MILPLIKKAGGVHEPEEEYYFGEILKNINPQSTILELGSYWAYYSAWFLKVCHQGKSVCIETNNANLKIGEKTYSLNKLTDRGTFIRGSVGSSLELNTSIFTVDYLIDKYFKNGLTILHSDIQGHELKMLYGAQQSLSDKKIKYLLISTHSAKLHESCRNYISNFNYAIDVDIDINSSSSFDGLIIASVS